MGKTKKSGGGFSAAMPAVTPNQQITKGSANQNTKEQRALALINHGELNEAEMISRALVVAGSKSHIVHGNLGALLKKKGDTQNAIICFNKAIQLKPNYPNAHYNLGIALQEQGDLAEAIATYNTALQLKPNHPDAH